MCVCVCVCVCVFVCPRSCVGNCTSDLRQSYFVHVTYAVARSSSGSVMIRYVLPVFWMTSRLLISQGCLLTFLLTYVAYSWCWLFQQLHIAYRSLKRTCPPFPFIQSATTMPIISSGEQSVSHYYTAGELFIIQSNSVLFCLQCFDAVGWAAGRASGL